MNEFFDLYDIEIYDEYIRIEALYIDKNSPKEVELYLEEINSHKIYKFNILDSLYNKNNILEGFKCELKFKPQKDEEFRLMIKKGEVINSISWSNNQNKPLNFNENNYHIYNNKLKIILTNNGLITSKKMLFSKGVYNFKKLGYGLKKYRRLFLYRFLKFSEKYILINDRVSEANDNGEALFKDISSNDKEMNKVTYYVLKKENPKYKELKKIGKVVNFGSLKHKFLFLNSKVVATSYIGNSANVYNPFSEEEMEIYKDLINKKVIFLQHGVMMTDFHLMFNRARMVIDKFVVSTKKEYEGILNQGYLYDENMLIKTGSARYDLLKSNPKNKILLFFTWRKWLKDLPKKDFKKSVYFKQLSSIIKNKKLNELLKNYNYELEIVLHAELTKFFDCFNTLSNKKINIHKSNEIIYSEMFNSSNILITDYSSIHFDLAYLKRPILYYQFDIEEFLKNHTNNGSGDFSYEEDGFGDVVYKEKELIDKLEGIIENKENVPSKYSKRINDYFFNVDNNNCKRIRKEIMKLYVKESKNYRFNNVQ